MTAERLSEITDYIIRFLLGSDSNETFSRLIGYTSDKEQFSKYKIVIIPSGFFNPEFYNTEKSLPQLPLTVWEGIPLLFGEPVTEKSDETVIIHADIIASSFFLMSRYEEIINRNIRDSHGRFPGTKSLPFRAGFLQQPVVDEYGRLLRKLLRETGLDISEPEEKFSKIYLTHDVDQLAHYRNIRGIGGAVLRFFKNPAESLKAVESFAGGIINDPWFTFPWLFDLADKLKNKKPEEKIENIVFIKTGGGELMTDKPRHDVRDRDFNTLFKLCEQHNVKIGLHPSYLAGMKPEYIKNEKKVLDETISQNTIYTRNHFLMSREPEDMQTLIEAGLTDDFTMAYADITGFRLGTCRAVKWIDPVKLQLTSLTLHPLTIMDNTLSDERYMNLKTDEAFLFTKTMIDLVSKHNGELVLLWHNTSVEKNNGQYHRDLYRWLINYLK